MSDNKQNTKKKKTLSLKLGSKPLIAPKRNIESGKTVIVEKKRYKRSSASENQLQETSKIKPQINARNNTEKNTQYTMPSKSGVVLKPLSKDEQKRILKADNKKDKKDEIEKIRSKVASVSKEPEKTLETTNDKFRSDNKENKREADRKKLDDKDTELTEKKKPQNLFGRKKIRERKVTIVTALSDIDERTRSLAAYKRSKQKTKKHLSEQEPAKKLVRDVYIPESITVKELANRMTEKSGDLIKSLMKMGMMATINESIDADTAELLVTEFGHNFK